MRLGPGPGARLPAAGPEPRLRPEACALSPPAPRGPPLTRGRTRGPRRPLCRVGLFAMRSDWPQWPPSSDPGRGAAPDPCGTHPSRGQASLSAPGAGPAARLRSSGGSLRARALRPGAAGRPGRRDGGEERSGSRGPRPDNAPGERSLRPRGDGRTGAAARGWTGSSGTNTARRPCPGVLLPPFAFSFSGKPLEQILPPS